MSSDEKYGQKWSEQETILAFYYYCKIPFGKIHHSNPDIIRLAKILGRSPGAVSFKMGNLGSFDPELKKRNIAGLKNASKTDKLVVERFYDDWEELSFRAEQIESELLLSDIESEHPIGETRIQEIKARVNQDFFREAVLSSYHNECCITGIDEPALLIASHIKPWKDSDPATERTNPKNGLCLNVLHDKAFDRGFITVLPDYSIRVSSKLKSNNKNDGMTWLVECDKQIIRLPEKFYPEKEFLEYHNDVIFIP